MAAWSVVDGCTMSEAAVRRSFWSASCHEAVGPDGRRWTVAADDLPILFCDLVAALDFINA